MLKKKSLRLRSELVGIHAIDPFFMHDSSSRSIMKANHLSQSLVLINSEERLVQSGIERELGKYTFSIGPECDCKILKIIPRYRMSPTKDSIKSNPETVVIYENTETYRIGHFSIPKYGSCHQHFGFEYKKTKAYEDLLPGNFMSRDTVVVDSPSKKKNGGYAYGVNLNTVFMSASATSEDGFVVSDAALRKLQFKVYEKRSIEFGAKKFPLNLYGDKDNYKILPEIGDYIHKSGMIMALRDMDELTTPVSANVLSTMDIDPIFDEAIYARGSNDDTGSLGKVIDIKVYKNPVYSVNCYSNTTDTLDKYIIGLDTFYDELKKTEKDIFNDKARKFGRDNLNLDLEPALHRLLVEAHSISEDDTTTNGGRTPPRTVRTYRGNPVDEYRVEITIESTLTANTGFKICSLHGDKGVICRVEKEENMPIDARGVRAEVIADGYTTISRTNTGRLYQHYFNGVVQHVTIAIRNMLSVTTTNEKEATNVLANTTEATLRSVYEYLLGFYKIASPVQHKHYSALTDVNDIKDILLDCVTEAAYLLIKLGDTYDDDQVIELDKVVTALENSQYRPIKEQVSFIDYAGNKKLTVEKVRIAPMYYMLLEKIADSWLSVASAKVNHFGILATTTKIDKYRAPWRASPTRTNGESEVRLFLSFLGREVVAEMIDRNANVDSHRLIYRKILEADTPTNLPVAIDRNIHPLGSSRPLQIVKHITACSGIEIVYEEEK